MPSACARAARAQLYVPYPFPLTDPPPPSCHTKLQALNWYWKVRVKLDDPRYADWFIKFKGFSNTPYPGGEGLSVNGTFHVPVCDWYNNGTAPRCSGFYHDQVRTPPSRLTMP